MEKNEKGMAQTPEKNESNTKEMLMQYVPDSQPNKEQYISLIQSQVLGTTNEGKARPLVDLLYFLSITQKTKLDPLARQVYPVYRWDGKAGKEKMTIQTGIDGYRLIAQRSNYYGGQDDAKYVPEDEKATHPDKATVTVYRLNPINGERMPVVASARWEEYKQVSNKGQLMGMWAKMPYNQLAKCAEALALRKAFAQELAGIYTDDEMDQANNKRGVLDSLDLEPPEKNDKKIVRSGSPKSGVKTEEIEIDKEKENKPEEPKDAEVEEKLSFPCEVCKKEMNSQEVDFCDNNNIPHTCKECLNKANGKEIKADPIAARKKLKKEDGKK